MVDKATVTGCVQTRLETVANGDYILEMRREIRNRSLSQNALMWYWFGIIAQNWSEAAGYIITAQDVHDAYCILYLPKETPKGRVAGNTKTLTKEQFSEFLEKVKADVQTEYGIYLPDEEDRIAEAYYNNNY